MKNTICFNSKFGWISAVEEKNKITKIKFSKMKNIGKSKVLNNFKKNVNDFFLKRSKNIKAPIKITDKNIHKKVLQDLIKIRYGKTKSYGQIAKKFNISPRYVGKICGLNEHLLLIPCHRVIRSDGNLGGFSAPGGIKLKKRLLVFEQL